MPGEGLVDRSRAALASSASLAIGLAVSGQFLLAFACYLAFSSCVQLTITIGITYRQLVTPDELRSSVNVIGRMVAWGGQPVGAVLGGLVAATAGVRPAIAAAGTVLALDALAAAWALRATPTHQ